ncbi:Thiol-disulfide oxidoreductase ResA [Planctomycetales bacterium 10988]|nr:Thiol-disulfide oxidoreductase ResA [Planctomycetales bacterium 10988]
MSFAPFCFRIALGCLLCSVFSNGVWGEESRHPEPLPIGTKIENFKLSDYQGKQFSLSEVPQGNIVVVSFLGTECPLAKIYGKRLSDLAQKFQNKSVSFFAIDANLQDSVDEMAEFAVTHGLGFPFLKDHNNVIADAFGAIRTPEFFLLNEEFKLVYRGRFDDQFGVGYQRPEETHQDLEQAIEEVLSGKEVSKPITEVMGCFIGRVREADKNSEITYASHIAAIFNKRCVNCHREGEVAPFSMISYDEVAGWGETIAEVIRDQRMPPWHANPEFGSFINDARMPEQEKEMVYHWVEAGMPAGNLEETPELPEFTEGWRIPEPDAVYYMSEKPFKVKAEGELKYQYFAVDPGFTEDKYVRAAECRPGNRAVVHHIIVGVKPPGLDKKPKSAHVDVDSEFLAATAPGSPATLLPNGMAKLVPAGSQLVFQLHYTPNGSVQMDRSSVGLVFADPKEVRHIVGTDKVANHRFEIPPHDGNHRVEAKKRLHQDVLMLSMFPHMHLRGKAFRMEARYPDGTEEVLLDIPNYDFNWQNGYAFHKPRFFPKGTLIRGIAHFDNSENNPANPDPNSKVTWGDQTWEEMMIGYWDYTHAEPLEEGALIQEEGEGLNSIYQATVAAIRGRWGEGAVEMLQTGLDSPRNFRKLGEGLQHQIPNLDRVCLTSFDGDEVKVEYTYFSKANAKQRRLAPAGTTMPQKASKLADFSEKTGLTLINQLSEEPGQDLKHMSSVYQSSLHVPVHFKGKPATLNLWSQKENAFPEMVKFALTHISIFWKPDAKKMR